MLCPRVTIGNAFQFHHKWVVVFRSEFYKSEFGPGAGGLLACLRDVFTVQEHKRASDRGVLLAEKHQSVFLSARAGLVRVLVDPETAPRRTHGDLIYLGYQNVLVCNFLQRRVFCEFCDVRRIKQMLMLMLHIICVNPEGWIIYLMVCSIQDVLKVFQELRG